MNGKYRAHFDISSPHNFMVFVGASVQFSFVYQLILANFELDQLHGEFQTKETIQKSCASNNVEQFNRFLHSVSHIVSPFFTAQKCTSRYGFFFDGIFVLIIDSLVKLLNK